MGSEPREPGKRCAEMLECDGPGVPDGRYRASCHTTGYASANIQSQGLASRTFRRNRTSCSNR
jgi:hypothetical protein